VIVPCCEEDLTRTKSPGTKGEPEGSGEIFCGISPSGSPTCLILVVRVTDDFEQELRALLVKLLCVLEVAIRDLGPH
jgi:hypothetical protein